VPTQPHATGPRSTEPLGDRVRRARLEAGLTQAQLAGAVISARTVSRIERGRAAPSRRVLAYIAERVGKPLEYFLDGPDRPVSDAEVEYHILTAALRREQGDPEGARGDAERALDAALRLGTRSLVLRARLELELARLAASPSDRAVERVRGAIAEARSGRAHEAAWWAAHDLAGLLAELGREAEAADLLRDLVTEIRDRAPELRACCVALLARLEARRSPGADITALLSTLDRIAEQRSPALDAEIAEASSRHAYVEGRRREAVWHAAQALSLRRLLRQRSEEARARVEAASRLRASGRPDLAEPAYVLARSLARSAGDGLTELKALLGLAELYLATGCPERATPLLDAARALLGVDAASGSPREMSGGRRVDVG
jgi:transcriptional regulator with XRE-family HTH domain